MTNAEILKVCSEKTNYHPWSHSQWSTYQALTPDHTLLPPVDHLYWKTEHKSIVLRWLFISIWQQVLKLTDSIHLVRRYQLLEATLLWFVIESFDCLSPPATPVDHRYRRGTPARAKAGKRGNGGTDYYGAGGRSRTRTGNSENNSPSRSSAV